MSLVFWDHYVDLSDLSKKVLSFYDNEEEKHETSRIIDDLIHQRMLSCVLDNLHNDHHIEFLEIFTNNPNDQSLEDFLKSRIKGDLIALFQLEVEKIKSEILSIFHLS